MKKKILKKEKTVGSGRYEKYNRRNMIFLRNKEDKVWRRKSTHGPFGCRDGPTTNAFWAPPFWESLESSGPEQQWQGLCKYQG